MEIAYVYNKKRSDFGKDCRPIFVDNAAKPLESNTGFEGSIAQDEEEEDGNVPRSPSIFNFDTAKPMSESSMNTDKVVIKKKGMKHIEGGWPKEVDFTEKEDTKRYTTKALKQDDFKQAVKHLEPIATDVMKQNNTVDIYESYFDEEHGDFSSSPPTVKAFSRYVDPNAEPRSASKITWHPSGQKIGVSYSIMSFQDRRFQSDRLCVDSYIWDIMSPNRPERTLSPPSPLCCMAFNTKQPDTIAGGCYNGLVSVFDLRIKDGTCLTAQSEIATSHHDPIYDVYWISSKSGTQFVTVATDGRLLYWDSKNLSEPIDSVLLACDSSAPDTGVLGGSCLEYNSEAGATKYLMGTEQGIPMGFNSKNKRQNNGVFVYDTGPGCSGRHHGPIVSLQRNPIHTKFFLTVGDWCARIWQEDAKTPLMSTKYHDAYLTGGCWSPTRPGVFYLIRKDGMLSVWDYNLQQYEGVLDYKVGDEALTSIAVSNANSRLVAVGDQKGCVSLLQVSASLAKLADGEKPRTALMFEREALQEKNLLKIEKDNKRAKAKALEAAALASQEPEEGRDEEMESTLRQVDSDFMKMVRAQEEEDVKQQAKSGNA